MPKTEGGQSKISREEETQVFAHWLQDAPKGKKREAATGRNWTKHGVTLNRNLVGDYRETGRIFDEFNFPCEVDVIINGCMKKYKF